MALAVARRRDGSWVWKGGMGRAPALCGTAGLLCLGFEVAAPEADLTSALPPAPHWWNGGGNPVAPAALDEGLGGSPEVRLSQLFPNPVSPAVAAVWMPCLLHDPALPCQGPRGVGWLSGDATLAQGQLSALYGCLK